jgi:NAD(P)-dependent dehydrogenase (short-subunit alcohol dehydrogenase family)
MRVNFHGHMNVTRSVLPLMRSRGAGVMIYNSSLSGWRGDPDVSAYSAAKFALEGAVESLRSELSIVAPGLRVHLLEPGYFPTEVLAKSDHAPLRNQDYASFNATIERILNSIMAAPEVTGDVEVAVRRAIELAKRTGVFARPAVLPLRLPLGSDSFQVVRAKCEQTLADLAAWEDVCKSTDLAGSRKDGGMIGQGLEHVSPDLLKT